MFIACLACIFVILLNKFKLRWGLSTNDSCDCGVEQTADHITSGPCPIYRPSKGNTGLIDLDDETQTWLENNDLDIMSGA